MKYLESKFSVAMGGDQYRENWEKIFKQNCSTPGCENKKHEDMKYCLKCLNHDSLSCEYANETNKR